MLFAGHALAQHDSPIFKKSDEKKPDELKEITPTANNLVKGRPIYLYVIEGTKDTIGTGWLDMAFVEQPYIRVMNITKGSTLYGERGKYGVIILTLKEGSKIITGAQLLNSFGIKRNDQNLPVYVDGVYLPKIENTAFMRSEVTSINASKQNNSDLKYLDIQTKGKAILSFKKIAP